MGDPANLDLVPSAVDAVAPAVIEEADVVVLPLRTLALVLDGPGRAGGELLDAVQDGEARGAPNLGLGPGVRPSALRPGNKKAAGTPAAFIVDA